jgi:hypothetical protein
MAGNHNAPRHGKVPDREGPKKPARGCSRAIFLMSFTLEHLLVLTEHISIIGAIGQRQAETGS